MNTITNSQIEEHRARTPEIHQEPHAEFVADPQPVSEHAQGLTSSAPFIRSGLGNRGNAPMRAAAMQSAQRAYGNRAVQRCVQRVDKPVQRFPWFPEEDPGTVQNDPDAGLLDRYFGLNPHKSFIQSGLEGLYGPNSPARVKEGDSTLTKLGRAGYSAAVSPLVPFIVSGGEILDLVNHPSHFLTGPFSPGPNPDDPGTFIPGNDGAPFLPEDRQFG